MPKKSRPTAQKGQAKFRGKQKRRKLSTIRRELLLKNREVATRKKKQIEPAIIPITIILNKNQKAGLKRHKHTVQRPPKRKNHIFLKKIHKLLAHYIFSLYLCTIKQEETTFLLKNNSWRGGRVVDCTGLENRRTERYRGFESLSLRKKSGNNES